MLYETAVGEGLLFFQLFEVMGFFFYQKCLKLSLGGTRGVMYSGMSVNANRNDVIVDASGFRLQG